MADLTNANTSWPSGTVDTATTLTDNVDQTHAQHINGGLSAVVALEGALGAKASLIGSKTDLATRLAVQMANDGTVIPPGVIWQYGASSAPTGWLLCDGSAVSRTTYNALYLIVGTTFGAGDGSTTFNVPDYRGRVAVGAGQGSGLTNRVLAASGGEENHALSVGELASHTHTVTDGGHAHGGVVASSGGSSLTAGGAAVDAGSTASATTGISLANTGSGTAHNTMQPFLVTYFIIKT